MCGPICVCLSVCTGWRKKNATFSKISIYHRYSSEMTSVFSHIFSGIYLVCGLIPLSQNKSKIFYQGFTFIMFFLICLKIDVNTTLDAPVAWWIILYFRSWWLRYFFQIDSYSAFVNYIMWFFMQVVLIIISKRYLSSRWYFFEIVSSLYQVRYFRL